MTTRTATTGLSNKIHDENNSGLAAKGLVKKATVVPTKRSALGDISNVANKPKAAGAVKVEQRPALSRVPIFASTKPTTIPAPTSVVPAPIPSAQSVIAPANVQAKVQPSLIRLKSETDLPKPSAPAVLPMEALDFTKPMEIDGASEPIEDIDINDLHDTQCCTEYVNDIFDHCREKEVKDAVAAGYMCRQADVNEKMRGILIDWMVEVHVKFKLLTETMFLSVSVIDRFLAIKPIARQKLQLVGITSMLLSSKYEEIYAPEVRDFVHISDNAYSREEILKMERLMLSTLDFNLSTPTPLHFLRRFSKAARSDSRTHTLSKYITELTLVEYKMIDFVPSKIAAASVYIARKMTDREPAWTPTLEKYTTYSEDDIMECALALNAVVKKSEKNSLKAVRKKYLNAKLLEVAKIAPVDF